MLKPRAGDIKTLEPIGPRPNEIDVLADATPMDFLCAAYRDTRQPIPRRMKAAKAALPFPPSWQRLARYPGLCIAAGRNDGASRHQPGDRRPADCTGLPLGGPGGEVAVIDGAAEGVERWYHPAVAEKCGCEAAAFGMACHNTSMLNGCLLRVG